MTPDDFREFGKQHAQRFPGAADYLRLEVNRADWQRALADVQFQDAADASYALTTGELTARGWSAQLAAILSFCRQRASERAAAENKPRYVDGEETYACSRCEDSGLIQVWSPHSVRLVRAGSTFRDQGTRYLAWCACDCEAGLRRQNPPNEGKPPSEQKPRYFPFDESRYFQCEFLDIAKACLNESDAQRFYAWARAERMPANYSAGLASYADNLQEPF